MICKEQGCLCKKINKEAQSARREATEDPQRCVRIT